MDLYKWQEDCLREWQNNDYRGIVNAITGTGKTVLALAAAATLLKQYSDLRIRIVAPTIALANQWRQAIIRNPYFKGITQGFYGDGSRDNDCQITIYVVNSARSGLEQHTRRDFALNRHVLLICDECHRYKANENHKMFRFIDRGIDHMSLYHCLGLSATPFNGENDDRLTSVLGKEIYRFDLQKARTQMTISEFSICQIAADFLSHEKNEYSAISEEMRGAYALMIESYPHLKDIREDRFIREVTRLAKAADMDPSDSAALFLLLSYERKKISILAESRVRCCIDLVAQIRQRGRIIIFSERIEQAERIHKLLLRKHGSIAGLYHSGMSRDARTRVLEDFRNNVTSILVSCRCLDEGLDVPDASIGIVVSGSAVPRQRIQRLGRIIRRSENKNSACLYYIYIRETAEDQAYLTGVETESIFDLRYYSNERIFSNDFYEYSAGRLLNSVRKSADKKQRLEIRRCILEGICLPDYMLNDDIIIERIKHAHSMHERNYYMIMQKIHSNYITSSTDGVSISS